MAIKLFVYFFVFLLFQKRKRINSFVNKKTKKKYRTNKLTLLKITEKNEYVFGFLEWLYIKKVKIMKYLFLS